MEMEKQRKIKQEEKKNEQNNLKYMKWKEAHDAYEALPEFKKRYCEKKYRKWFIRMK